MAESDLGTDFGGGRDLDPALRMVSGNRALAESVIRRLTTDKGALRDFPAYGFNIENLIGSSLTASTIRQKILGQVYAEEEIRKAAIELTLENNSAVIILTLTAAGPPFALTLSVTDLGVEAIIPASV